MPKIHAFVQARMTSQRFPGKVLAPFRGEPIIAHICHALCLVLPKEQVIVLTSSDHSDNPLVAYCNTLGMNVYRGPLNDVFQRFRCCLEQYPCDWILRICADSPLIDDKILHRIIEEGKASGYDLITTTFPRTHPRGYNVELIRTRTFNAIDTGCLTVQDREHVTSYFYRNPELFQIKNISLLNGDCSGLSWAIDTIDDLKRLENEP